MSDLNQQQQQQNQKPKEIDKETQLKIADRLYYENNLGDVTKDRLQGFDYNTENLLYTETTQSMVMESDIEALAKYSELKAKQRSEDALKPEEFHTNQYKTGKRAIGIMSAKESHRSMKKRKNKMDESVKRLNNVGEQARNLKAEVQNKSAKERIKSMQSLYNNVRMADRYFAEGIAGNKNEENKLKEKAEITYAQNLYNMYSREIESSKDENEKESFIEKRDALSEKLKKMKDAFAKKYSKVNATQHKLEEGEMLLDDAELADIEKRRQDEERIKAKAEEVINKYEKDYKENTINKNEVQDWFEKSINITQEYLYTKSKYSDGDKHGSDYGLGQAEKELKNHVFMDRKESYYNEIYKAERKKLFFEYKKISIKERENIIRATPAYKNYENVVREAFRSKLSSKLGIESGLNSAKTWYERKNNLVGNASASEINKFNGLRTVESYERRIDILKKHLEEYSKQAYQHIDLTKEKEDIEERILNLESQRQRELTFLREKYIAETNHKDPGSVTYEETITYLKNNIKLKDSATGTVKSLKEYDIDQEIAMKKEILEKTDNKVPAGGALDTLSVKLSVWNEKLYQATHDYYFPNGSELVEKLLNNIAKGSLGSRDINRHIEKCLRPVKFDERGKVLKEYEKNDEFNRKFIDSHVKTTLTDDTKNDDKVFEERLPSLLDIMDEIVSFKLDEEIFSIDYISKSQDNFVNFQHIIGTTLTFHSNVLKEDRINIKLKEYCEKDSELKKKWDRSEMIADVIYRGSLLFTPKLQRMNLDNEFRIIAASKEESLKDLEDSAKGAYEKALKEYNDKFGGE